MLESLLHIASNTIENAMRDFKVILFSPRSRNRNALMGAFLKNADAYLYTLTPQDSNLDNFLKGLVQGLAEDNPGWHAIHASPQCAQAESNRHRRGTGC